jgi:diacylglycerol kinase (ATP)
VVKKPRFQKVVIIINPGAGKGEDVLRPINDVLHPAGVYWDVSITNGPGEAVSLAREAVEQDADAVGVVGGDGTVAEVAQGLAGSGIPLVILPGGTGNGAAGEFGIPKTIVDAVGLLVDPEAAVRAVDLGQVGEKCLLLRCACGALATVDEGATRELKSHIGGLAYVWSGLAKLGGVELVDYHITCDGEVYEARGITCIVANGAGFGGVGSLAEGIASDDGKLDALVFTGEGRRSPVKTAAKVLPGVAKSRTLPMTPVCSGAHIVVESSPSQEIVVDGEPVGCTPMEVQVLPGALHLLVPAVPAKSVDGQAV